MKTTQHNKRGRLAIGHPTLYTIAQITGFDLGLKGRFRRSVLRGLPQRERTTQSAPPTNHNDETQLSDNN